MNKQTLIKTLNDRLYYEFREFQFTKHNKVPVVCYLNFAQVKKIGEYGVDIHNLLKDFTELKKINMIAEQMDIAFYNLCPTGMPKEVSLKAKQVRATIKELIAATDPKNQTFDDFISQQQAA
jgi:hypothetical protein